MTTTVAVKCECEIPFQYELERHLERLISCPGTRPDFQTAADFKKLTAVLHRKLIFIRVTHPIGNIRPMLVKTVKLLLNKDLVGTIKVAKNEITLILL